jgi:dihydrofolate reductase
MYSNIPVVIVAGIGEKTRAIGRNNQLLWHVSADLKRFKELTVGKPVIMGRKTFESILTILGKPLPSRTNIVVTRQSDYKAPLGVLVVPSLEAGLEIASQENPSEIHIGGGAEIYKTALPLVDKLYLTLFADNAEGDAFFPPFYEEFIEIKRSEMMEDGETRFTWVDFVRK